MSYFKSGEWNAICDVCGFQFKSGELRLRWDGMRVCSKDWETRHPMDFIKIPKEDTSVPWSRPVTTPATFACTLMGSTAISGSAVAGCSVAGRGAGATWGNIINGVT